MGKISKLRLTPTLTTPPQEEGVNADELATLAGPPHKTTKRNQTPAKKKR